MNMKQRIIAVLVKDRVWRWLPMRVKVWCFMND
jgi:hypothetical protein